MTTIGRLLESKAPEVYGIDPDAPVIDALRLMAEHHIGAVLALRGGALAGIVSERDYARKVVLAGRSSRDTAVREIMTEQVTCVGPEATVDQCMRLVTEGRFRHLPVLQGGAVIGVVSIGDLVKAVIEAQQQELDHLQRYIAG
ncbi:CBS domain-containing protein [Luteimonas huabeiensis]|uniref:CBS domain-containing protein n=1 Tax=Luteimonas huabeiensis TaxID=1244513 RepID=UPI0004644EE8|nr:CBS domain-containing protein [Luteimonas huabeiensis]